MNTFLEVLIRVLSTGPDALTRTQLEGIATTFGLAIPPGASDQDVRIAINTHIMALPNPNAPSGIMLPAAPTVPTPAPTVPTPPTPATLRIRPNRLPNARQGRRYNQELHATGGHGPYTWDINETWVSINPTTGRLSGKPGRWDESQDIDVTVTDSNGVTATQPFSLRVEQREPIVYPDWVRPLGIIAGIIAALIILFFAVPPLANWTWDHSYWGDDDTNSNGQQAQTQTNGGNTNGSGNGQQAQTQTNGGNTLNNEQLAALKALGLTDAQIAALSSGNGGNTNESQRQQTQTIANGDTPASDPNKPKWLGSECKVAPTIPTVSASLTKGFTSSDSLAYPNIAAADPGRSGPRFPDTNVYGYPPRAGYEESSEDANYFEDCFGDLDVPQYYYRVNTAGYFWIPKSEDTPEDIVCMATETKGCALITINHFGPTMKLNGVYVDNGFTYFGRVWDMSQPQMVTDAAQSLLDHVTYRMIYGDTPQDGANDGTNCGNINGCMEVEWHVVIYGGNKLQKHWMGTFKP